MSEDYWDGAVWVYSSTIANDSDGSGALTWNVVPGAGNEMELLYGTLNNLDTSSRSGNIHIQTPATAFILQVLIPRGFSIGASDWVSFPSIDEVATDGAGNPGRMIISGTMALAAELLSVAASQDGVLTLAARIRGGVPTVTNSGQGTSPTITVNHDLVL